MLVTGINEGLMLNTLALKSSLEYQCAIMFGAKFLHFSNNLPNYQGYLQQTASQKNVSPEDLGAWRQPPTIFPPWIVSVKK